MNREEECALPIFASRSRAVEKCLSRVREEAQRHSSQKWRTPRALYVVAYKDKPEMTAALAEQYTIAGNSSDALVIPAGLAFAKAIAKRPDLELYQPDKRRLRA